MLDLDWLGWAVFAAVAISVLALGFPRGRRFVRRLIFGFDIHSPPFPSHPRRHFNGGDG